VPDRCTLVRVAVLCSNRVVFLYTARSSGVPWLVNAKAVGLEVSKELNEVFEGKDLACDAVLGWEIKPTP